APVAQNPVAGAAGGHVARTVVDRSGVDIKDPPAELPRPVLVTVVMEFRPVMVANDVMMARPSDAWAVETTGRDAGSAGTMITAAKRAATVPSAMPAAATRQGIGRDHHSEAEHGGRRGNRELT